MPEGVNLKSISILILGCCLILLWPKSPVIDQPKVSVAPNAPVLMIERLDIIAPINFAQSTQEAHIQKDLQSGVVHLKNTAYPGTVGNAYIVGHSSDYAHVPGNFKQVFKRLPEIKLGDIITLEVQGQSYDYEVFETRVVEPSDLSVLSQETNGRKILSVQTSYPVGTALQRFLAFAELVEK